MPGAGTSSQAANTSGNVNVSSNTNPWPSTIPALNYLTNNAYGQLTAQGGPGNSATDNANYGAEIKNLQGMPNFGPQAAGAAGAFMSGDPTGLLRAESQNIGIGDPANTPGMQNVLKTIQNDVSNQVNGQFAGAGRSLSGLNEQTLARGLSQGEAVPLLNQYNQNIANQMGIQSAVGQNVGQGFNYAQAAPQLATLIPQLQESLYNQYRSQPYSRIGQVENLINPMAGLGGTSQGTQQSQQQGSGTATNSLLGQLGQAAGLISPFGGLLGSLV